MDNQPENFYIRILEVANFLLLSIAWETQVMVHLFLSPSPQGQPGVEVPEGGMLGQHQKQLSGGGGSLSISDLVAAGTALSNTRQESNSDDDYD